ncbi:phosphatase PAP2 family protein [Sphingopyxis sp. PAMC25046]|uniref:phosphatase PAP2 family protein n=1 Tax=Sphingopyxis sp. PAMC25046 TaxID=2565556 RepID=UPI00109E14C5|nr:phosphatase PAP2 family protein [Sphingopyxis sp. PAMC25046]QCB54891.1 phosphatase PAP2 family protein [Sphingopyxis sp. PAMC25046]
MFRRSRFPALALALFIAVVLLGFAVGAGWTETVDWQISQSLSLRIDESAPAFIAFMQWASWIGGGTPRWIIVILLCGLVWHWCGPRCAVALGGASLLSNLASSSLKLGFGRARPDLIDHLDHQTSFSYPSGHATSAAVVYLLLAWLAPPRWRPFAWTLAAAMIILNGSSRIMLGVHWASDIAGGTMLGTAFALLGAWWVGRQKISA